MYEMVIGAIAANALVLAVLGFLFRSIITHFLSRDVENFKARIQLDANRTISAYQSELEKERIRLQISYGGIFEKQADVILEIFKLVVAFEKTIDAAMYPAGDKGEEYHTFIDKWRGLIVYLDDHRILIPESVEILFEKFHKGMFGSVSDYRRIEQRISRANITNEQLDKLFARQDKALADIDQIPEIKKELVHSLRRLMGITEVNASTS